MREHHKLTKKLMVVVVSDHGMMKTQKAGDYAQDINKKTFRAIGHAPVLEIQPIGSNKHEHISISFHSLLFI